jgi:hypothetical protein
MDKLKLAIITLRSHSAVFSLVSLLAAVVAGAAGSKWG